MRVTAADGSTWKVTRYRLRELPSRIGSSSRAARSMSGSPQPGTMFDQGVRGEALGCLVPLELASVAITKVAAVLIAPLDLALCGSGRRPWPITARRFGMSRRHTWHVYGWTQSSTKIDEVAQALRTGRHLPAEQAVA